MGHENQLGWVTYLRVSDEDKQTPERSFAMQRHSIQEHLLATSSVPFQCEYFDILTGTTPNRKDYQQMLADAEAGRFSHLGLYRADRFGRNAAEGLQAATKLISLGIKLRVANMPTLQPETPDGFFMFLLQMGLAQREVDVLRQRTSDGMEAKLRAGGWPFKAPAGYLNRERLVSSNKYDRWVEVDSAFQPVMRAAWDLLLSDCYTLDQTCEELLRRGFTQHKGRPWAWTTQTGKRMTAANRLHQMFHRPFYAGYIVSDRYQIVLGDIKGTWEPIVSLEEFERGVSILRKNDRERVRVRKWFYLLRGLLYIDDKGDLIRAICSTAKGRSQRYAYYISRSRPNRQNIQVPCRVVDEQIPGWLAGLGVAPENIAEIRSVYQEHIQSANTTNSNDWLDELKRKLTTLREEEAQLGRLLVTGKISEAAYDQLRLEWQEKSQALRLKIQDIEQTTSARLDDLEVALALLTTLPDLYPRLQPKQQTLLLKILANRIIINPTGEILRIELNSPFSFLRTVADTLSPTSNCKSGYRDLQLGVHEQSDATSGVALYFSLGQPPNYPEDFFEMLRFDQRGKLNELPLR